MEDNRLGTQPQYKTNSMEDDITRIDPTRRNTISDFLTPPPPETRKKCLNKIQTCFKLRKMERKLVKNNVSIFGPPPLNFLSKMKKKVVPNWPK